QAGDRAVGAQRGPLRGALEAGRHLRTDVAVFLRLDLLGYLLGRGELVAIAKRREFRLVDRAQISERRNHVHAPVRRARRLRPLRCVHGLQQLGLERRVWVQVWRRLRGRRLEQRGLQLLVGHCPPPCARRSAGWAMNEPPATVGSIQPAARSRATCVGCTSNVLPSGRVIFTGCAVPAGAAGLARPPPTPDWNVCDPPPAGGPPAAPPALPKRVSYSASIFCRPRRRTAGSPDVMPQPFFFLSCSSLPIAAPDSSRSRMSATA